MNKTNLAIVGSVLAALATTAASILAQTNTYPWPSSGNVGIGTTAPVSPLSLGTPFVPALLNITATQEQIYDSPTALSGSQTSFYTVNQPSAASNSSAAYYATVAHTIIPLTSTISYNMAVGSFGYTNNYGSGDINTLLGAENISYHRGAGTVTMMAGAFNSGGSGGGGTVTRQYGSYNVAYNYGTGSVTNQFGVSGYSFTSSSGTVTSAYAVYGAAFNLNAGGTITSAYGGYFDAGQIAGLTNAGTITNFYGIYIGSLYGSTKYSLYAADSTASSYFAGNVGIGTTSPTEKLAVNGRIRAKEVIVETNWSDFVFDPGYRLAPLSEVEQHIKAHGTLPGVPSEAEVAKEGVSLGDMQARLLQKIEELTLYTLQLKSENDALKARVTALENR